MTVIGMPETGIERSVNESVKLPSFTSPATLIIVSTVASLPPLSTA